MVDAQADGARSGLDVERIERLFHHTGAGQIGKKIQCGVAAVDGDAVVDRHFGITLRVAQIPAQDVTPTTRAEQLTTQSDTGLAQAGRDIVVQRRGEPAAWTFLDTRVQPRLARPVAGRQLGIDALDERALQKQLQAVLQRAHVERGHAAPGQPIANITAVQMLGPGDRDVTQSAFDDTELDDARTDLLVRQQCTRIDVAGIDILQRQGLAQSRKVLGGDIATQIRRANLLQFRSAENSAAGDPYFTHPDARRGSWQGGRHRWAQGRRRLQQRRALAGRSQRGRLRVAPGHCRRAHGLGLQQHGRRQQRRGKNVAQPMLPKHGGSGSGSQGARGGVVVVGRCHGPQPSRGSEATIPSAGARAVVRGKAWPRNATVAPRPMEPRSRLGR